MDRIVVGEPLTSQFEHVVLPVEVFDENGRPLGHFVPRAATWTDDDCPFTPEELAARRAEKGGRSLAEIWRSLTGE